MRFEDCRVGMEVVFGRGNGEYTRGIVEKTNRAKAKVRTIENRGKTVAGALWSVPYSLLEPSTGGVSQPVLPQPIHYHPFQSSVEVKILEAINAVYTELSPEFLTCDGEATVSQINIKRSNLTRQLRGLFQAFGREVDESTAYDWQKEKQEFENKHLTNS